MAVRGGEFDAKVPIIFASAQPSRAPVGAQPIAVLLVTGGSGPNTIALRYPPAEPAAHRPPPADPSARAAAGSTVPPPADPYAGGGQLPGASLGGPNDPFGPGAGSRTLAAGEPYAGGWAHTPTLPGGAAGVGSGGVGMAGATDALDGGMSRARTLDDFAPRTLAAMLAPMGALCGRTFDVTLGDLSFLSLIHI